jgi:hypothetical protein
MTEQLDYLLVALFGALVGGGEIISRYRDAPTRAVTTTPAVVYLMVNAAAAVLALALIRSFGWSLWADAENAQQVRWAQVIVAGLGAMATFRSSLFTFRSVGDEDIGVGFNIVLQQVLQAADRGVDRLRAKARSREVVSTMDGVSFDRAHESLTAFCLALMQNLPKEDQGTLAGQIEALRESDMEDAMKSLILGLALMNAVGPGVLQEAVVGLGERMTTDDQTWKP